MNIKYQYIANVKTEQVLKQFKNLLFPDLNKKNPARLSKHCDVVMALKENQLIGLLVANKNVNTSLAELQSLAVVSEFRNQGIGKNLFLAFEKGMLKQNVGKLQLYYRAHWPSINYLSKILDKQKWSPAKVAFVIVDGKAKNVLQLFDKKQEEYPPSYTTIPWSLLNPGQKDEIKVLFSRENVTQNQNPFNSPHSINKICSLALYKDGIVAGWVVSHIISEDSNEYTSFYISPQFRSHNLAYALMRETIFRQHQLTNQERFIIVSQANNHVMSRFLLRHAKKTEVKLVKTLHSEKLL